MFRNPLRPLAAIWATVASLALAGAVEAAVQRVPPGVEWAGGHLVASIAPSPDGAVTGDVSDFVINLSGSVDPTVPGRTLLEGRHVRITLPKGFTRAPSPPGCPLPPARTLLGACNDVLLLSGSPLNPILPFASVAAEYDQATRTITLTATRDIVANPPAAPGIKQIHLLLPGFRNPPAGRYRLSVEAETGPDGALETGSGFLDVLGRASSHHAARTCPRSGSAAAMRCKPQSA